MAKRNIRLPTKVSLSALLFFSIAPLSHGAISLGAAGGFAVLGSSTVTNTGSSVISGELGVSTGFAITGFPPGVVIGGSSHSNDALAALARADAQSTFDSVGLMSVTMDLTGQNLGGLTLTPGVYHFDSTAQLTGILTLDGLGLADPVFVFQVGSDFTTATAASVVVINGVDSFTDIIFRVGGSTTLGTATAFAGTIISLVSNTLTTGASVDGRVIALTGAVTLDNNRITVPEPAAPLFAAAGLALGLFQRKRRIHRG